jgi:DNA-binding response OmpR family regulator
MTPTEYTLLTCLATTPGRVVTYSDIANQTHSEHLDDTEAHELLRWHVRNLRHKLDRRYLVSVRGVGYMLIDPDEEVS